MHRIYADVTLRAYHVVNQTILKRKPAFTPTTASKLCLIRVIKTVRFTIAPPVVRNTSSILTSKFVRRAPRCWRDRDIHWKATQENNTHASFAVDINHNQHFVDCVVKILCNKTKPGLTIGMDSILSLTTSTTSTTTTNVIVTFKFRRSWLNKDSCCNHLFRTNENEG